MGSQVHHCVAEKEKHCEYKSKEREMYSEKAEHHSQTQKNSLQFQFQIKQDDKFFCRLLSKESSISNPSFRVTPIAIPFVWESQPGTPKHTLSHHSLPPLTPPPSYYNNNASSTRLNNKKNPSSRSKLFRFLIPKFNLKTTLLLPSSNSSSSRFSSDSSSRVNVVVPPDLGRRRRFLSYDSSVDLWGNDDDVENLKSSSFCFRIRRTSSSNAGFGSCCRRQA